MLKLNFSPTFLIFFMSHDWHKYECRMPVWRCEHDLCRKLIFNCTEECTWSRNAEGENEESICIGGAAVLRTPLLCSDQHNTAIWLDMGVGVSGGSLQFIYKGGNFNDITIRHVLYYKPWQESVQKISSTNFKKRKKGCKYFWALFSKSLRGYFSSKVWNNRLSLVSLCSWPGTERAEASKVEIWMVEEANMVAK